ncbi:hypothetical protein [Actinophytocola sp.]|uniref:hypothetical protein n=1 Tax=Actinophytocola sp. TaxID=1872138 RepID=UPI003D6AC129
MDFVAFVAVAVAIVLVQLLVAFTRKGSVATIGMTKQRIVLHAAAPPDVVYSWLTQHCPAGYSVEDADPARRIVILSSRTTLFTLGFFYPTFVYAEGGGTRVAIGIKSKAFQYGPLPTRDHRKLAQALASLIQNHEGR